MMCTFNYYFISYRKYSDVWTVFIEVPWNQNQSINNITNNTTKKVQDARQSTVMQTQTQVNFETKLKIAI